jgi:cyclopropane-fatty-acyl-phospholipid synthase
MAILDPLLKNLIQMGNLRVLDWKGQSATYGDATGSPVTIRIHDGATAWRLIFDPQLAIGEAYMDGRMTIEEGSLFDFLEIGMKNIGAKPFKYPLSGITERLRTWIRRIDQFNPASRSKANVAHHYDLSDALYDLFLDADRQYSCSYVMSPDDTLETAQAQKKRHIAAKLLMKPGHRVLDIGSGWGGLGLYLGDISGADITGLTLSEHQLAVSNDRAAKAGFADRIRFKLLDYRSEAGKYDRIVSVGMFEHVGVNHFNAFFQKIADALTDDGVALIHAIGRADGPGHTNPWIDKYIFPGGYCPALSEVIPAIEKAGLLITDIEILRLHYAETLKRWRERFDANREKIRALYDDRFCRMWEFYLSTSELAFRYQGQMVFQIQLAKKTGSVPITRDYIAEFEAAHPPASVVAPVNNSLQIAA